MPWKWLTNRLSRSKHEHETIPHTAGDSYRICEGMRRGLTQRPMRSVRLQNRRRNQIARASRKRNRV